MVVLERYDILDGPEGGVVIPTGLGYLPQRSFIRFSMSANINIIQ
jgi:hypothetical protein